MSRYVISVESKIAESDSIEEAISRFGCMILINRAKVKSDLIAKGESNQIYGFCQGTIRDREWVDDHEIKKYESKKIHK